jgi:hypothetical protein
MYIHAFRTKARDRFNDMRRSPLTEYTRRRKDRSAEGRGSKFERSPRTASYKGGTSTLLVTSVGNACDESEFIDRVHLNLESYRSTSLFIYLTTLFKLNRWILLIGCGGGKETKRSVFEIPALNQSVHLFGYTSHASHRIRESPWGHWR